MKPSSCRFPKMTILPDGKWSERASAPEYDLSLHAFGLLITIGDKIGLYPWHAIEQVSIATESPQTLAEEPTHANPAPTHENPAEANVEPSSAIATPASGRAGASSEAPTESNPGTTKRKANRR